VGISSLAILYQSTSLQQHVPTCHFLALKYVLVMGAVNGIYILVRESRWNLSSYIVHCNIALTFAHNSTMVMTFGMTFVGSAVCEG
jgi:hypothetical protein